MPSGDEARFARNPGLIWTAVDGETVMLSIDRGEYFGLGGAGGSIWEALEQPRTAGEICARLVAEYEVDPRACREDVAAFLRELLALGIVRQG